MDDMLVMKCFEQGFVESAPVSGAGYGDDDDEVSGAGSGAANSSIAMGMTRSAGGGWEGRLVSKVRLHLGVRLAMSTATELRESQVGLHSRIIISSNYVLNAKL